jgi:hypothetical protein
MRGLIGIVGLVAVTVAACDRPVPVALNGPPPSPPDSAGGPTSPTPYASYQGPPIQQSSGIAPRDLSMQSRFFGLQYCAIHHRHKWTETGVITGGPPAVPDTMFVGQDGQPQRLTREQCEQENAKSLAAEEEVFRRTMDETQRAVQVAQQNRAAVTAQIVRDEAARGYKRVTVKDLYLDAKTYAANQTKLAVQGFYKSKGRHDERLYLSYDEYMMHTLNPAAFGYAEGLNVGLITEDSSRSLREYLLQCVAGCKITILGRADQCTATNAFGATSHDVCLVAEDMERAQE